MFTIQGVPYVLRDGLLVKAAKVAPGQMGLFDEGAHPRDDSGRFTSKMQAAAPHAISNLKANAQQQKERIGKMTMQDLEDYDPEEELLDSHYQKLMAHLHAAAIAGEGDVINDAHMSGLLGQDGAYNPMSQDDASKAITEMLDSIDEHFPEIGGAYDSAHDELIEAHNNRIDELEDEAGSHISAAEQSYKEKAEALTENVDSHQQWQSVKKELQKLFTETVKSGGAALREMGATNTFHDSLIESLNEQHEAYMDSYDDDPSAWDDGDGEEAAAGGAGEVNSETLSKMKAALPQAISQFKTAADGLKSKIGGMDAAAIQDLDVDGLLHDEHFIPLMEALESAAPGDDTEPILDDIDEHLPEAGKIYQDYLGQLEAARSSRAQALGLELKKAARPTPPRVGQTKTVNGALYRFNQNHRWERAAAAQPPTADNALAAYAARVEGELGAIAGRHENYIPITEYRWLPSVKDLPRPAQDRLLYSLQASGSAELSTLQDVARWTSEDIAQGIEQDVGGSLFFISLANPPAAAAAAKAKPPSKRAERAAKFDKVREGLQAGARAAIRAAASTQDLYDTALGAISENLDLDIEAGGGNRAALEARLAQQPDILAAEAPTPPEVRGRQARDARIAALRQTIQDAALGALEAGATVEEMTATAMDAIAGTQGLGGSEPLQLPPMQKAVTLGGVRYRRDGAVLRKI